MQRKVGAAPHRGNANRPLTIQGKAKTSNRHTLRVIPQRDLKKPPLGISPTPFISPINPTNNSPNRSSHQIGIDANPKRTPSHISPSHFSDSNSPRIRALSQRPLLIVLDPDRHPHSMHQRIKRPIPFTAQHAPRAINVDSELDMLPIATLGQTMSNIMNRLSTMHILLLEQFPDL